MEIKSGILAMLLVIKLAQRVIGMAPIKKRGRLVVWLIQAVIPLSAVQSQPLRAISPHDVQGVTRQDISSSVLYDFNGNSQCPTEDDGADLNSREGVFSDFARAGVECAPGVGVFTSKDWPTSDVREDTSFVGFSGETAAEGQFAFGDGAEISFSAYRSSTGPMNGELLYVRHNEDPRSIGTWTLDDTTVHDISFSLSTLREYGSAVKIQFQVHGWGATSNAGSLTVDDVSMTFAIATSVENPPEQAGNVVLPQVYPNPFSSTTTLSLLVPQMDDIRIEIFDALGRAREVIHNGPMVRGEHLISINGSDLPAGTYFVRVSTLHRQVITPIVRLR